MGKSNEQKGNITETTESSKNNKQCGIIMPISSIDNCDAGHWAEVKNIISEAITKAGYTPNLVSDANDSGVIQKRIVQNIYDNEIVVCDVSCKNPNVMFELGMRLAFDKPTIIVIDDKTDYSFDTAPIEHLNYPRDLRYSKILEFKEKLADKIKGTIKASHEPGYTTFLKNFGEFHIAEIENKKGSANDVILSRLEDLRLMISDTNRRIDKIAVRKDSTEKIYCYPDEIYPIVLNMLLSFSKEYNLNHEELVNKWNFERNRIIEYIYSNDIFRKKNITINSLISIIDNIISTEYKSKIF